jgi:hypothetical protein
VIRGATTITIVIPGTGHGYTARVVGYDASADVAVLQAGGASGLKTIAVGDSSSLRVDGAVTAVSNAGGTGAVAVRRTKLAEAPRTCRLTCSQPVHRFRSGFPGRSKQDLRRWVT